MYLIFGLRDRHLSHEESRICCRFASCGKRAIRALSQSSAEHIAISSDIRQLLLNLGSRVPSATQGGAHFVAGPAQALGSLNASHDYHDLIS